MGYGNCTDSSAAFQFSGDDGSKGWECFQDVSKCFKHELIKLRNELSKTETTRYNELQRSTSAAVVPRSSEANESLEQLRKAGCVGFERMHNAHVLETDT